jgi:hypothetical protein
MRINGPTTQGGSESLVGIPTVANTYHMTVRYLHTCYQQFDITVN